MRAEAPHTFRADFLIVTACETAFAVGMDSEQTGSLRYFTEPGADDMAVVGHAFSCSQNLFVLNPAQNVSMSLQARSSTPLPPFLV